MIQSSTFVDQQKMNDVEPRIIRLNVIPLWNYYFSFAWQVRSEHGKKNSFTNYTLTLVSFASHLQTSIHQGEEICPVVVPAAINNVHETNHE